MSNRQPLLFTLIGPSTAGKTRLARILTMAQVGNIIQGGAPQKTTPCAELFLPRIDDESSTADLRVVDTEGEEDPERLDVILDHAEKAEARAKSPDQQNPTRVLVLVLNNRQKKDLKNWNRALLARRARVSKTHALFIAVLNDVDATVSGKPGFLIKFRANLEGRSTRSVRAEFLQSVADTLRPGDGGAGGTELYLHMRTRLPRDLAETLTSQLNTMVGETRATLARERKQLASVLVDLALSKKPAQHSPSEWQRCGQAGMAWLEAQSGRVVGQVPAAHQLQAAGGAGGVLAAMAILGIDIASAGALGVPLATVIALAAAGGGAVAAANLTSEVKTGVQSQVALQALEATTRFGVLKEWARRGAALYNVPAKENELDDKASELERQLSTWFFKASGARNVLQQFFRGSQI